MTQEDVIKKHSPNHNDTNFYHESVIAQMMDEWASHVSATKWIDAKERPLITRNEKGHWECTDDGSKEFVAAVPYRKTNKKEENLWWIRLCIIEDTVGLTVVGDDYNEPAGWQIDDVTHYFHLPTSPEN